MAKRLLEAIDDPEASPTLDKCRCPLSEHAAKIRSITPWCWPEAFLQSASTNTFVQ
jgi:hypothetical protein